MNFLNAIRRYTKGPKNANRTEGRLSGRGGRECRDVYQVNAIVERAVSDFGDIRMLEAACADERSRNPGEVSSDSIREESRVLIAAAKRVGCFVKDEDVPGTRYSIRTGESEVRFVQKDRVYFKLKDPFAKSHLKKHPVQYALYEHIVHNVLFPACQLEFVGVSEVLHEARIVYRQKAVRCGDRPDDRSISDFLLQLGLRPAERYCFGNEYLFVTDVGQDSDNVLQDAEGRLYFIDPIIGFRELLCKRLGGDVNERNSIRELVCDVLGSTYVIK